MMRNRFLIALAMMASSLTAFAAKSYDNPDTIVVARDGTGEFRNVAEAVEVCRAFMEYHKVIYVKNGVYKEKLVIPSWLTNIEICGESAENTIITFDDHANVFLPSIGKGMGTFRTYTLKIEGSDITLKNITIENNSARLGQAVALHAEGDRLKFVGCRFLGHQDTVYTGAAGTRLYFKNCYIEGTTDYIFGPSVAWFENCDICSTANSYVTAASTPEHQEFGYVFYRCRITALNGITKVYLGRPWRRFAKTVFIECELGPQIVAAGWKEWSNKDNLSTVFYAEYKNDGPGANTKDRAQWTHQLTKKEVQRYTLENVMKSSQGDWKF